ncbi:MAG: hypothetical protein DWH81_04815 [Planctomycetota bacterium]|nr:MAG: hypothetical protein DWH81_04815 [Planctomycetota bacterium]
MMWKNAHTMNISGYLDACQGDEVSRVALERVWGGEVSHFQGYVRVFNVPDVARGSKGEGRNLSDGLTP